jgi:uncharacterized membrane protein YbaN (DUF454 family)
LAEDEDRNGAGHGPRGPARLLYLALGVAALALGTAGAFLPLLPTTPFVILAAWAFARSSPRLHAALHANPRLGPALRNWERYGAISRRAKAWAAGGMLASWVVIVAVSHNPYGPAAAGLVMLCSGAYVLSRPTPPRDEDAVSAPSDPG